MILAVDAGNTNIVAALMEDEKVISTKRFATGKDQSDKYHYEELLKLVNECCAATDKSVQGSIISSVVPCINKRLETACEKITGKSPLIVDNTINTGMTICYDNPSKLGADLICDGAGAVKKYGAPVVVIDIGTATTFSIIDEKKKLSWKCYYTRPYHSNKCTYTDGIIVARWRIYAYRQYYW